MPAYGLKYRHRQTQIASAEKPGAGRRNSNTRPHSLNSGSTDLYRATRDRIRIQNYTRPIPREFALRRRGLQQRRLLDPLDVHVEEVDHVHAFGGGKSVEPNDVYGSHRNQRSLMGKQTHGVIVSRQ
jgi:hypothetical protein